MNEEKMEVNLKEKIAYGSFIGGQKLVYILVATYATLFYLTEVGLSPLFVSVLILGTRLFDAFNDPIIGILIDRSKIKMKTYLKITTVLLPIMTFLIFLVPTTNSILTSIYVIITYILWSLLYTIGEVPSYSIAMRMTKSKNERNKIFAGSQIGSLGGVVIGMVLIGIFIASGIENTNWIYLAGIIGFISFLQMLFSIIIVKERYSLESDPNVKPEKIWKSLISTMKNKHLYTIMGIYMGQLFLNASGVLAVFVFEGYYNRPALGNISAVASMLIIIPLAGLLAVLVRKFGKTNLIYFAATLMIGASLVIFGLGSSQIALILLPFLLIVSTLGTTFPSLLRPLYAQEVIDFEYERTGKINSSAYFSIMTFFNKAGDAFGSALGSILLIVVGYNESLGSITNQSVQTIESMRILYLLGPILMAVTWIIGLKFFYKLANQKKIKLELERNTLKDLPAVN